MASPTSLVTYEIAQGKMGTLPSVAPRPNTTKIRAIYTHLRGKLVKIPSFQSTDHGYQGMVDSPQIYALNGLDPWIDFPDPGYHRLTDGTMDDVQQRDAEAVFKAVTIVFNSQQNVKASVNDALNDAVPRAYRRNPTVMGVREYRPTDDPREIIAQLTRRYGRKTSKEVNEQDALWRQGLNPSEPIEEMIDRLENTYIFA
jgi:hypothetical protein